MRSQSWTHLMRTVTKIPRWSCSCCATTSLCGPVTRRVRGTSHRKAATTNLPKLKSFLNLIRTSYSLSSPRPPWSAHLYFHPPRFIHPCPPVLSSLAYLVSFFPFFFSTADLFSLHFSFSKTKQTDPSHLSFFSFFLYPDTTAHCCRCYRHSCYAQFEKVERAKSTRATHPC